MNTIGIIPARLQSSRLPRKLLLAETGKPLLQYAWEAACRASELSDVIIASDSEEITQVARAFGARVEMTGEHPSGTDRIAEVVRRACPEAELIVNVQGDEPELEPENINRLVQLIASRPGCEMATLATPIRTLAVLNDPSCVKVVCAADSRALYFSRSVIPHLRDGLPETRLADSPWLLHLGIYAYRREFLLKLTQMEPSRLEQLEKLEQLRALESGASILVHTVAERSVGIDTPADYAGFVARKANRS
ncbi:MAG: 3-deoxy-manno-octulosonate cytidylyltransferase [Planctomycetota bacterium]|nr:MAG: 3-deoxy-manno-octulosonate cytidylyltransferase [Planctomycetota bacterium]